MAKDYIIHRLSEFSEELGNKTWEMYEKMVVKENEDDPHIGEYLMTTIASDMRVTCGNNALAKLSVKALNMTKVYRYVVTAFPNKPAHPLNFHFDAKFAFHGIDIYAFLNTFGTITEDVKLQSLINFLRRNVKNFVVHGKPDYDEWGIYPQVAELGKRMKIVEGYAKEQCDYWRNFENGILEKYWWIN